MEPFGLFDLLKTLLPDGGKAEDNPPTASPATSSSPTANSCADTPHSTANSQGNAANPTPPTPSANACWAFMERHDARAKNAKKHSE